MISAWKISAFQHDRRAIDVRLIVATVSTVLNFFFAYKYINYDRASYIVSVSKIYLTKSS